jgi:peptidoglycan L-alanyl-D-glutamate endopeptidase CwlK
MVSSTSINDLRPDVAANCKILLDECKKAGFKAGLSCTFRDQEYQTFLHKQGKAPPTVTFHGKKLAFDIYENLNGKTSYRDEFFNFVAPLAKKMGFTWMQDITGADKPHFQWDAHRQFKNADILANRLPPQMPPYKDEITGYKETIQAHCKFSDPDGVWKYMDQHPFSKEMYRKWAESYK